MRAARRAGGGWPRWLLPAACIVGALCACAPAPLRQQEQPPLVWPEDVEERPRIAFVQAFSTPADLGIATSFFERLADLFLGASEARLVRPMAVVAAQGAVYVADPGARGVHRFDRQRGRHDLITAERGAGLPSPVALALGADGEVYVSDSQLAQVLVIRPGARVAVPLPLPPLGQPTGLAFDPAGRRLLVVDTTAHRVNVFGPDGRLQSTLGRRGLDEGEFNYPTLLARDARGQLYVTDSLNFRVQVFDAEGRFLRMFGQPGDRAGDNMRQKGVATDSFGHVYVLDSLFSALQIFDQGGQLLLSLGSLGSDRGEFWMPVGIFIDEQDRIYVADSRNQRVQILRYIGGPP